MEDINLNNITTIGNASFYGCKSLKTVQFSEKNDVTIGKAAFSDCGLVDIEIPNSVKKIGESAFSNNYVTDPKSLEHNATTYEKYKEYQEYINEDKNNEEKVSSVKSVSISVCDEGLDLEPDTFSVDDTCQVSITYQKENGKPVFEFINQDEDKWEGSDISATQLNSLKHITYLCSETESSSGETTEDGNYSNGVYTVTLVKNARTVPEEWKIQVQNGKLWKDYLKEFEQNNQIWNFFIPHIKDVHYNFNGWKKEDGQFIEYNDTIELHDDLTLYTDYSITGNGLKNQKIILKFYGYDKTVEVTIGTKLYDYDIPKPHRSDDEFLGWVLSKDYPIKKTSNIISKDTIIQWDLYQLDNVLYPVYQSDIMDKSLIATTEVLSGQPIYRLNTNNIGKITNYDNDYDYKLDQTAFNESDKQNANIIKNKILTANKDKIAILPKGYSVNVDKLKKRGYVVIKTNLELDDYISTLTYINCRYFQYLQLIQTPYFKTEGDLKNWDKKETGIGYCLTVSDFELVNNPSFCKGLIYFIKRDKFKKYYNLCQEMENKLVNINENIDLQKGVSVTDALWKINELCVKNYAYDNYKQIYDLNWFLQITDEKRNEEKKADYHGVCASYSKLAFALLGLQGYEAIPTAVGNGKNPTHSVNKVILDGKTYYCDYTWASSDEPKQYMFLTTENMIFTAHMNPVLDDMGHTISYDRKSSKLATLKIKSAKNQKGKKIITIFNKIDNADGYEIQYSTNRKFKSAKKKTVSKTKIVITKLKKNKTYYVRIRPYKNVKMYCTSKDKFVKIKYYGTWSKFKKVKIKK